MQLQKYFDPNCALPLFWERPCTYVYEGVWHKESWMNEHFLRISQPSTYLRGTLGFLAKISFTPLLYHPGGCLGCPEMWTISRNYNLFVWFAAFQPKWNDIQKSYKSYKNPLKSYCSLGYFQSLFNFGWKTAAQTN